jgi:CheY-like chemotaxis protein
MSDLSTEIGTYLPYLRRYARALTGSQTSGDKYAVATIEAILADRSIISDEHGAKVGLFRCFHAIWKSSGSPIDAEESGPQAAAQRHLAQLTNNTREALLLKTIEGFLIGEVAVIMSLSKQEVTELLQIAQTEMERSVSGKVLIIEDEPIIAADIEHIVAVLGHKITGVARTHSEAVELGKLETPDLILADIQLADNSSGIDAVHELLTVLGERPVIFITAFPERLLTGERPEPAFLISKPYSEDQVQSAVSQAMFFASTETLKA